MLDKEAVFQARVVSTESVVEELLQEEVVEVDPEVDPVDVTDSEATDVEAVVSGPVPELLRPRDAELPKT